ncbi:DUF21 domain-containing protein At2g14520-like [Lytechinus variegatus]|uniref:DUF21 domain-containing protein At2g14520-like n=1 Tax=Lytechinus variegatus TaxID=7654 RepID=UPI001BB23E0D|nr:DUF21 domain-containing protein At2g14520-like [Lytechinus variegatus]
MAPVSMATAAMSSSTVDLANVSEITEYSGEPKCNISVVPISPVLEDPDQGWFWVNLILFTIFTFGSGLYSALTTSFFSQDLTRLEVCLRQGTRSEKVNASRVMRLLKYPNLLIVTLNMGNVAAIVCQPIVLAYIISPILSVLVSAITVFIFNKLLPQLVGDRHGLVLAANMAWFVYISIAVFFIIAWPVAMLLSVLIVKRKDRFYERAELKALIELQMTSPDAAAEQHTLTYDEVHIIKGALDAESKVAMDAMIPLDNVSMLDYDGVFDRKTMQLLATQKFSHVPVYKNHRKNVQGEFVIKELILLDPEDQELISTSFNRFGRSLHFIPSSRPLYDIFDDMSLGRYRIAAVLDDDTEVVIGFLTLQNVLDVILGQSRALSRRDSAGTMKMVQSGLQIAMERRRSLHASNTLVSEGNHRPTENTPLIKEVP